MTESNPRVPHRRDRPHACPRSIVPARALVLVPADAPAPVPPPHVRRAPRALAAIGVHALLAFALVACDPDVAERAPDESEPSSPSSGVDGDTDAAAPGNGQGNEPTDGRGGLGEDVDPVEGEPAESVPGEGEPEAPDTTGSAPPDTATAPFALALAEASTTLLEGGDALELAVELVRDDGHTRAVTLSAIEDGVLADGLVWGFTDGRLDVSESGTTLNVSLPIGPRPRLPETRRLRLVATDGVSDPVEAELVLETTPTDRPDIYLLAGQSNMVGSTLPEARMAGPGEPDAPDPRILQLDVTINDLQRFPEPAAYTDVARIAAPDNRIVEALDPLHDIRDRGKDTKSSTRIGLGLSFAKAALADTTAAIVLVPAAWSDTGFCLRETSRFGGATGWNAVRPDAAAFAGTLLHDRAIARTNLAIEETGGILRGILWHQGEADSDDATCALAYEENLRAMVRSLRENIAPDARGAVARGPEADIPFVLATMSKGSDARGGALAPGGQFPEPKSIVDGVHRDVSNVVPLAAVVNADDLVPAAYPCGQGFCIHFGATALRELGTRYYRELGGLFDGG